MSPIRWCLIAFATVGLVGCNSEPASLLVSTPTRIIVPAPVATPIPTPAPTDAPTATRVVAPTIAPTVATIPMRTPTTAPGTMKVKLFFVALDDNGKSGKKIGCNDSIVAVERTIPATPAPLTATLKELLSIKERNIGQSGLYNALANANLKIDAVAVIDGTAIIQLSGTLGLGGVCDDPRVEAQLKELALQFSTVKNTNITLNGVPIEKALSGKGN